MIMNHQSIPLGPSGPDTAVYCPIPQHISAPFASWSVCVQSLSRVQLFTTPPTILLGPLLCPWMWGISPSCSRAYHHWFWVPRIRWCSLQTSGMWARWQGRRQPVMSHPASCPGWGAQVQWPGVRESCRGPWPRGQHAVVGTLLQGR